MVGPRKKVVDSLRAIISKCLWKTDEISNKWKNTSISGELRTREVEDTDVKTVYGYKR